VRGVSPAGCGEISSGLSWAAHRGQGGVRVARAESKRLSGPVFSPWRRLIVGVDPFIAGETCPDPDRGLLILQSIVSGAGAERLVGEEPEVPEPVLRGRAVLGPAGGAAYIIPARLADTARRDPAHRAAREGLPQSDV
jgi:hypothetical protein